MAAMGRGRVAEKNLEEDRRYVTALARGLKVLRCFNAGDRFLGNLEISRRTGLPKATVTRLTFTLTELDYLNYSRAHNKYCLGTSVISLGYSKLAQMDIRRIARPLMQALAEHTQASVNLGMRDHLHMVYIDTYRNSSTFTVQLDAGSQIPIASTSMGRAYLAALDEQARGELLEQIRHSDRENWPAISEGIEQALRDYAERGFCFSMGDWRKEVHAVAVPLKLEDTGIMVFSCSGASFQLPRTIFETDIGPRLLNLVGNVHTALVKV